MRFAAIVRAPLLVAVALALGAAGCGASAPTVLGLRWTEDAAGAARRLRLRTAWSPWSDPEFETSQDAERPLEVLGERGVVRLVRAGRGLEGVQVSYTDCAASRRARLVRALARDLGLESAQSDVPYEVWGDDSLVHFETDAQDGTCTLTVAGPRFGRAFQRSLLRSGLEGLSGALRPH